LVEACKQVKKWQKECDSLDDFYISINVSARQFAHPELINEIRKVLHHTDVNPKNIRLEITETTLIEYTTAVEQKFKQLRELGVDLAIDDFGTGYSSLSYLKNIPAQCLKIDQSFIRELGQQKRASDLVKAMIELASDLNLEVIAEGIESPTGRTQTLVVHIWPGLSALVTPPGRFGGRIAATAELPAGGGFLKDLRRSAGLLLTSRSFLRVSVATQGQKQDGRHVKEPGHVHGQVRKLADLDIMHPSQFTTKPGGDTQCDEPGIGAREEVMPESLPGHPQRRGDDKSVDQRRPELANLHKKWTQDNEDGNYRQEKGQREADA
jgi:hypothetical protein